MHLHCLGEYVHLGNEELHQPLLFRREQFIPNRVEPLKGFRYVPQGVAANLDVIQKSSVNYLCLQAQTSGKMFAVRKG